MQIRHLSQGLLGIFMQDSFLSRGRKAPEMRCILTRHHLLLLSIQGLWDNGRTYLYLFSQFKVKAGAWYAISGILGIEAAILGPDPGWPILDLCSRHHVNTFRR